MRSSYPYTILNFKMATDIEHDGQVWLNWSWNDPYWTPNLDHWEVWPSYSYVDTNGVLRWMDMSAESVEQTNPSAREWSFYWDLPISAEEVYFRLRPIAKTKSDGSPEWEEEYYSTERKYFGGATKPDTPSAPSITQQSTLGIQVVLSLTNVLSSDNNKNVTKAEFQTIQFNGEFDTGTVLNTVQGYVDDFGNVQAFTTIGTAYGYKFRARLWGSKERTGNPEDVNLVSSEWSELTEFVSGAPEKPSLKVNKYSSTQVEYTIETNATPHHFQIEIAPSTEVFDKVDEWERQNPSLKENSEARASALLSFGVINEFTRAGTDPKNFQLSVPSTGQDFSVYRVRSVSAETEGFYSSWSDVTEDSTLIFSDGLRAPIVWSAKPFALVDEPTMQLCVMHNSPNGSPSCLCKIGWAVNHPGPFIYSEEILPPSGQSDNTVYYFNLDISSFTEETVIYWRAKTYEGSAAIEENASPLSEIKSFSIHAKPTIDLIFPDLPANENFNGTPVVSTFPLKYRTETTYFESVSGPINIISYGFKIYAKESYKTYDKLGRLNVIKAGDVLYSLLDTSTYYDIDRFLNATDITLENGKYYIFEATVALDNGATASTTREFVCNFAIADCVVECTHVRNDDTVALYLNPVAVKYEGGGTIEHIVSPDLDHYQSPSNSMEYCEGVDKYGTVYKGITYKWPQSYIDNKTFYGTFFSDFYTSDGHGPQTYPGVTGNPDFWIGPDTPNDVIAEKMGYEDPREFAAERNEQNACIIPIEISIIVHNENLRAYLYNSKYRNSIESIGTTGQMLIDGIIGISGMTYDEEPESFETDVVYTYRIPMSTYYESIKRIDYSGSDPVWAIAGGSLQSQKSNAVNRGLTSFNDAYWTNMGYLVHDALMEQTRNTQNPQSSFDPDEPLFSIVNCKFAMVLADFNNDRAYVYDYDNMSVNWPITKAEESPEVRTLVDNVELSVYRKNDDGTFVKIDENIPNNQTIYVTDPHPNLGGAEYRIVATNTEFGTTTYYDPPPIDMKCTDIILQWDESYGNRPNNGETRDFISEMGNIVRLPYNVDVSESANIENETVKYIGRKDPVSYYGTQTGYTATWNTEIPKYDKETIKMLRKLQVFPGDVYVREPNGTGYWAHVTVTFPINHCALTVSVSLNITRVEGGK